MRLDRLDFGKQNETVRGTAFDLTRNVLYAITARSVDPLYAISIADPRDLKILSTVDGLSATVLAGFTAGQVQRVVKQGNNLVLLGYVRSSSGTSTSYQNMALVYDLSNPLAPRRAAQVSLPSVTLPYYYYYCGWAPWAGYWWNATNNWTSTTRGLVMLAQTWDYSLCPYQVATELIGLDVTNPDKPRLFR